MKPWKPTVEEVQAMTEAVAAARTVQTFLWGEAGDELNDWGWEEWLRMLRKRVVRLEEVRQDNLHAEVEIRKRLLQTAALSVALMGIIDRDGRLHWDKRVTTESGLSEFAEPLSTTPLDKSSERSKLVYLAAPYSHPDPKTREDRFREINKVASMLMKRGVFIYSPISHSHPIAVAGGLPTGWEFWNQYDEIMLSACGLMIVLMMPGWQESVGVSNEIKIAVRRRLRVVYVDPDEASVVKLTEELAA